MYPSILYLHYMALFMNTSFSLYFQMKQTKLHKGLTFRAKYNGARPTCFPVLKKKRRKNMENLAFAGFYSNFNHYLFCDLKKVLSL